MTPALLLAALLAVVAYNLVIPGGVGGKVAVWLTPLHEPRDVAAWAAGTWVGYGMTSLAVLIALGRVDAILVLPPALRDVAWWFGEPGEVAANELARLAGYLALGLAGGVILRTLMSRFGWRYRGYRSPAAAHRREDIAPALALALAAGVGEELFFRLTLPLLMGIVTGSGAAGVALGFVAFVALHRHQGPWNLILITLVAALLTFLYLSTGSLLLAVGLHVAIDVAALAFPPRR